MTVTYNRNVYFETNHIEDFEEFVFGEFMKEKGYIKIMPEIKERIALIFNENEKISYKKLGLICSNFSNGCKSRLQEAFWTYRGYTEKEATKKISELQSKNGEKFAEKQKQNPEKYIARTWTQLQYWKNKGYIDKEAKQKLSEMQSTFSREKMCKRYGKEKGEEIIQERNQKWQQSLKENNDMKMMNRSKGLTKKQFINKHGEKAYLDRQYKIFNGLNGVGKASKQSLNIFSKIIDHYNNYNFDIFIGTENSHEFHLYDKKQKNFYLYDFTLFPLNIIIEFNGSHVHPNKEQLSEEKWENWKQAFNKLSADEIYEYDMKKIHFAEQSGFKVLTIWDTQNDAKNIEKCINFIDQILLDYQESFDIAHQKS